MKRLKMAIAALLAFALLPLIGSTALADESSASSRDQQIRAAANIETIADASTMGDWSGVVENTTQNIGRIWTDKTVSTNDIDISGAMSATVSKGDSDFITALSVLSSTSNIASTSTTPLDIVLVLDASGSMDDDMTGGKRIDALKNAANAFIDEIATQNASISDASKQHQVSIVKFAGEKSNKVGNDTYREGRYTYNYSQVMKNMTACSETTKSSFKDTINAIKPAGATNAAAGMELAQGQTSNRADAKKIVIFFTDGTPTTQSEFSNGVASDAISAAKAMKDAGASVYTIGIFDGANPSANVNASGTSNENKFMQAASSNYPAAAYTYTQYWLSGEWKWSFGNRAEGSDFYKSASSASELSKIFEDISKEIVKGAGYPTDAREGFEMSDGYITFDDSLGSYMQVDAFKAIVVNNHVFSDVTKATTDTADTYTFAGTTELNGKTASLGNIVITVTKSSDVATGDKVQVKVPAGLIPLRNFNVNETAGTMTVGDTYPLRVFFTSSIKPDALALVANPDEAMAKYIAANTENGKVNFCANAFTPGAALGDIVSHFNPSKGNAYYYFTSDTPIYSDEACTQPATRGAIEAGGTHYYQNHFFAMGEGGAAVSQTEVVSFPSGTAEQFSGALAYDASGNAYFKAGTARLTYIDELAKSKAKNITGTATDVLNPKWNSETSTSAATTVIPHLGNNGKLSVEIPGTLAVSKTLDMPEGFDAAAYSDKSFDFELTVEAAAGKTLHAEVKNAAEDVCGDPFELTFDENGKATHSIKADETLYVYGVAPNAAYSVEELLNVSADDGSLTHANPGFSQTSPVNAEGKAIAATGTVVAGEVAKAEFVNTYAAQGTLEGSTALAGAKTLNGRAWLSSDKFTFVLKDANTSVVAPMPEGASDGVARLEVTRPEGTPAGTQVGFCFGDIVYTQPGTYIYQVYESEENSTVNPGVSMSQALYEVKVVVADKHDGTFSVESVMTKLADDNGVEFKTPEAAELAAFTNTFSDQSVTWNPSGTKTWNDATGQRTLESGMFFVMAKTIDASAPLPKGDGVEVVTGKTAGVDYRGVVSTVSAGGSIAFPQATFSLSDLGGAQSKTYVYEITEVVKVDNAWVDAKDLTAGKGLPGVTYDPTVWQAIVTVESVGEGANAHIKLSVAYAKQGAATDAEAVPSDAKAFAFENSYNPEPAVPAISGTKVFQGRAMTEAESFGFGLVPANKAATDAFGADFVKQATVSGLANGGSKTFSFDELSFAKPGTYTFKMVENAYCSGALSPEAAQSSHIAFDTHECLATVKVTDDHSGTLRAEVSYDGGATFTNVYSEEKTYGSFGGLAVEKTLEGRTMHAGEFAFSIEGADDVSKALLKLIDEDCSGVLQFSNPNDRAAGVADVMKPIDDITFTQADAGKTFEFVVSEVVPGDDAKLAGVTYDEATHKVKIAVSLKDGMNLDVATYVDGKLVERGTPTVAFTNTYAPANTEYATTNFGLNKVLEGRDWTENDSFSFSIVAETGVPMPSGGETATVRPTGAKDGEAVPFDFGNITFTASDMLVDGGAVTSKTFVYTVSETVPNPAKAGIQYSTNVAKIYVTVTDDGEGHLVATSSTENGIFVNKYETSLNYTAAGGLTLTKTLNGRDMTQGQFQIRVVPRDEASAVVLGLTMNGKVFDMPAAKDGKAASVPVCSDVEFTQLDAGKTFTYTVSELVGAGNVYTFDKAVRTVAIAVSDDPATATLTATTMVSGGPDAATYAYKTGDSPAAVAAKVSFTNSYSASGSVDVNATKTLSGRALTDGEFHFGVQYAKGEAAGSDVLKATNAADGTVAFGTLNFDTAKLNELVAKGSATKMTSDNGDAAWTIPCIAYEKTDGLSNRGITATTQSIPFTINAADAGSGALAVTIEAGDKGLAFENTYGTGDVSVRVTGVKSLSHAEGLTPGNIKGKFTFTIKANEKDAPMPERVTTTNADKGNIDFGEIVFTLDALNKALGTTQQGATADTGVASIQSAAPAANDVVVAGTTVGVEVAGDSAMPAQAMTGNDLAGNAADGAANADGSGQGAVPVSDDAVGLAAASGAEPAAVDTASGTSDAAPSGNADNQATAPAASVNAVAAANAATDNAAASVQSAAPAAQTATVRSHVFTYTITETGSAPGVTNDTSVKTVSFKVTDNGKGELTVERVGDETKPTFEFTNAYSVTPVDSSVTDQIPVSKSLVGRELVEREFLFELVENGQVVARGTNDAAGNVSMSVVTYTTAGEHGYVLREVGAGTTHNGVTFDGKSIAIHTRVVDNGEGGLVVKHALAKDDANAAFVNTYAHGTTSVVLGATKVLSGKALADGQFTFALTAEDGTVYQAKNDAAGSVAFPALTFAEPGTYVYTISEVNDKQANVTYDTATYNVVVNVVDDGQGNLVATVAYDGGVAPTFKNFYTEPPAPTPTPGGGATTPKNPVVKLFSKTADDAGLMLGAAAVAAGLALVVCGAAACWRRRS